MRTKSTIKKPLSHIRLKGFNKNIPKNKYIIPIGF